MWNDNEVDLASLLGQTLVSIKGRGDELWFETEDGNKYKMYHSQSCCESVTIEDITGDLDDLIGNPLVMAECVTNHDDPKEGWGSDSHTWTFYKLGTIKGTVTIRWYGSSNGYYSESVDFVKVK